MTKAQQTAIRRLFEKKTLKKYSLSFFNCYGGWQNPKMDYELIKTQICVQIIADFRL